MRLLRSADGTLVVVQRATDEQCRVRRLDTGDIRSVPVAELRADATALGVPERVEGAVGPAHANTALALLAELDARGPTPVRALLDDLDICESDLHGLVAELRAADLLASATVYGERGYEATPRARRVIADLETQPNS